MNSSLREDINVMITDLSGEAAVSVERFTYSP